MKGKRQLLINKVSRLEGDDDPHYFNFAKCGLTAQELIDEKKHEMETSPDYAQWREDRFLEMSRRKADREDQQREFLRLRQIELKELDEDEDS